MKKPLGRQLWRIGASFCEDFDLILMDVQMPEMEGFAATKVIREKEERKGGHMPIVAMTGDSEKCLAAGMHDYSPYLW